MDSVKIRQSFVDHNYLWMILWIIVVVDLAVIIGLSLAFTVPLLLISGIAGVAGLVVIKMLAAPPVESYSAGIAAERQASYGLGQLMEEIRPVCDEIFAREIDNIAEPVIDHMRNDFTSALGWLWEGGQGFLHRVKQAIYEISHVIHLVSSSNSDSVKIIQRLKYDMDHLIRAVTDLEKQQDKDRDELERFLANKVTGLKESMDREKDIFYDYVQKMLIDRVHEDPESLADLEYFNVARLGEQFSNVVEKSLQARLDYFEKSVLYDLEQLAADIVGKIQKGTLQLMTTLKEMEELLGHLLEDDKKESSLTIRKLADARDKTITLKEESNQIMLTLAWSDILTEKRWQVMQEALMTIKDEVEVQLDEEFLKYIAGRLDEELPDYYDLSSNHSTAMVYRSLLDAEIVYHAMRSGLRSGRNRNDAYVLLEFMRPVEAMAAYVIQFSAESASTRRLLKEKARRNEFQNVFDQVNKALMENYPEFLVRIDGLFPQGFNAFCNNPHIAASPEDAGQAAWMVFMQLIDNPQLPADFYLLVGLLLYLQQVRKTYIHPLKSQALPLKDSGDIENVRTAVFRIIKILILYDTYKHKLQ